mgnify:CR=1 FL=1
MLNLGRCGDDTPGEFTRLQQHPLHPDLVVLQYYPNDIDAAARRFGHTVPQSVPFAEDAEIAGKIRNECHINQQLGEFITAYAREKGVATQAVATTDPSLPGRVLVLEIRDAVSEGNAFLGHHKSTSVRGAPLRWRDVLLRRRGCGESEIGGRAGWQEGKREACFFSSYFSCHTKECVMAKQRQLYETNQQAAFTWLANALPPAEPCEFCTIPASNPSAKKSG